MRGQELVVLTHGFFRTTTSMEYLRRGLEEKGHPTLSVSLPTWLGSLADCTGAMNRQISPIRHEYETVSFVGHSMGALAVRSYLLTHGVENCRRCVFIAPPHGGTPIADFLHRIPLYSAVFRPIRDFRTRAGIEVLPLPDSIEVGVIAGSRNTLAAGLIFLSRESDGRVEIDSTRCPDMRELLVLPFNHFRIKRVPETLNAVDRFLRFGSFTSCRGDRPTAES